MSQDDFPQEDRRGGQEPTDRPEAGVDPKAPTYSEIAETLGDGGWRDVEVRLRGEYSEETVAVTVVRRLAEPLERAVEHLERAIDLNPCFFRARWDLARGRVDSVRDGHS